MRQRSYGSDPGLTLRMLFTMALLLLVGFVFLGLLAWAGVPWQFLLIFAIGMAVFQYFMSDKMVLLSTGAKVVTAEEEPWLHATIERLSAMADIPKPKKIAIMDTHVPNAFATGRNPNNAVVAVTRGLLSRLDQSEVEAVLGHELAHVKNRDVMVMTWASIIVIFAGYLLNMLGWMALFGGFGGGFGGGNDRRDAGQFMLVMIAVYVGTIVIYFVSQMLIMTLSRYREFAADRSGSVITGAPMQLASALAKISSDVYRIPEKDLRQVEHASAFFIIPALQGNSIARLFSSHPPVEQRIERLRNMQHQIDRRV